MESSVQIELSPSVIMELGPLFEGVAELSVAMELSVLLSGGVAGVEDISEFCVSVLLLGAVAGVEDTTFG